MFKMQFKIIKKGEIKNMWIVIDMKTKEKFYEGQTYKQCLNYIDILHKGDKFRLNVVVKE